MTRCLPHCCIECKAEWKTEQDMKKREAQQINACHASPFPAFVENAKDELEDGEFKVPLEEKLKPLSTKTTNPFKKATTSGLQGCFLRQSRFGQPLQSLRG